MSKNESFRGAIERASHSYGEAIERYTSRRTANAVDASRDFHVDAKAARTRLLEFGVTRVHVGVLFDAENQKSSVVRRLRDHFVKQRVSHSTSTKLIQEISKGKTSPEVARFLRDRGIGLPSLTLLSDIEATVSQHRIAVQVAVSDSEALKN